MQQIIFPYNKCALQEHGVLPYANDLFSENYQFEVLQQMKLQLNDVKSKLNNFNSEKWRLHTVKQNPSNGLTYHLLNNDISDFITKGWCKFYEILCNYPQLVDTEQLNSLHLCEAPGAFVSALNHYLHVANGKEVQWKWLATSLNPYCEANSYEWMIDDDRFIFHTLGHWLFHNDFTGNIINRDNIEEMKDHCNNYFASGEVNLITADGSMDCQYSPDKQEECVELLNFSELIAALDILADGGNFVVKMFTCFEATTVCRIFLLYQVFRNISMFKPSASGCGNSEIYLICLDYNKSTGNLPEILLVMKQHLKLDDDISRPLFPRKYLTPDFIRQVETCSKLFAEHQTQIIQDNIKSFETKNYTKLKQPRLRFCTNFSNCYNITRLPDNHRFLSKFELRCCIRLPFYSSYTDMILHSGSRYLEIKKAKHYIRRLTNQLNNELSYICYSKQYEYGQIEQPIVQHILAKPFQILRSSCFVCKELLFLSNKVDDLYNVRSLWIKDPTVTFNETGTTVKYLTLPEDTDNFSEHQYNFFLDLVKHLLNNDLTIHSLTFYNMPFLTHFSVSLLKYLTSYSFKSLSITVKPNFEIVLRERTDNYLSAIEPLYNTLMNYPNLFSCMDIKQLHRNDFHKMIKCYNNHLLLNNCEYFLK